MVRTPKPLHQTAGGFKGFHLKTVSLVQLKKELKAELLGEWRIANSVQNCVYKSTYCTGKELLPVLQL